MFSPPWPPAPLPAPLPARRAYRPEGRAYRPEGGSYASESATTDVKLDPLCIERSKPYLDGTYETRSGPGVSGRGGAKYCWDVVALLVLVLVLVLDPFGTGLHQLYFFDYENEDDDEDEKQPNRHFQYSTMEFKTCGSGF